MADCQNVEAVQGRSPQVMQGRDESIDMFFDDSSHREPRLPANLKHFVPLVKPGGIICGDDFASGWPSIVENVYKLADSMEVEPEVSGRIWSMLKRIEGESPKRVYDLGEKSDIEVTVSTKSHNEIWKEGVPNIWSGNLHKFETITGLKIEVIEKKLRNVEGRYQLKDVEGNRSAWTTFGEAIEMDKPIVAVRAIASDENSKAPTFNYQVCAIDMKRRKTRNSKSFTAGDWASLDGDIAPISAFRMAMAS